MKGLGSDKQKIIDIVAYRSAKQRNEITVKYQQMYGRVSLFNIQRIKTLICSGKNYQNTHLKWHASYKFKWVARFSFMTNHVFFSGAIERLQE